MRHRQICLAGLCVVGITMAGKSVDRYLQFPPRDIHVEHASFSWWVFGLMAIVILGVVLPFVVRVVSTRPRDGRSARPAGRTEHRRRPGLQDEGATNP